MLNTVSTDSSLTVTIGALRSTLPVAPPRATASVLVRVKAIAPNTAATIQNSGDFSCWRHSNRKISKNMGSVPCEC